MFRSDGLDSPLSPNGQGRATWARVWAWCDASDVVESYNVSKQSIKWVGEKEPETFGDPQAALNAIRAMSAG
jgi:hypothetical protein